MNNRPHIALANCILPLCMLFCSMCPPPEQSQDRTSCVVGDKYSLPTWLLRQPLPSGNGEKFVAVARPHSGEKLTLEDLTFLSSRHDPWMLSVNTVILPGKGMEKLAESASCQAIGLHNVNVDDSFFELLEKSTRIEKLAITRLLVTDKAIESISKTKSIRSVFIDQCPLVTPLAISQLKALRPDITVDCNDVF